MIFSIKNIVSVIYCLIPIQRLYSTFLDVAIYSNAWASSQMAINRAIIILIVLLSMRLLYPIVIVSHLISIMAILGW